jgi:hypothetical protein
VQPTETNPDPDVPFDPWGGRLERTLRLAVPSFVHRLNNALGPVTGFTSVAARTGEGLAPDRTVLVGEQAERAAALARSLSEVTKTPESALEAIDLVEWLRDEADFLDGCVEGFAAGVRFVLEPKAAPVRAATRPLLQALFVGLVEAAMTGARDLELVLRVEHGLEVVVELRAPSAGPALPPRIGELTGATGGDRTVLESGSVAQRLRFATLVRVEAPTPQGSGPLVVVVERDPFLREEVEQVLIEQGYRVSAHERGEDFQGGGDRPAALLVDAIAASTAAVGELLTRTGPGTPVCVMGQPSAPLDADWPHLPKPFRPGELIERVAALVGR